MKTHTWDWLLPRYHQINLRQFGWALIPALALLVLRELGKYVARRRMSNRSGSTRPEMIRVTADA